MNYFKMFLWMFWNFKILLEWIFNGEKEIPGFIKNIFIWVLKMNDLGKLSL